MLRMARHIQDGHLRAKGCETLGQVTAGHLGHHHVRHEQMDRVGVCFGDPQGLGHRPRAEHGVAMGLQHLMHQPANLGLVFDEQKMLC